ncbi:MAG: hypothetical protein PWR10_641 [Halanaerobiales bacterium]|nr:hypothetical protein [Halanaerobiales bacterium]
MKKLLIIRSVSFQQLDKNIITIQEKYKDYNINLLTHEHGVKLAEKYKMIDKIHIYPYKGSFKFKNKVKELADEEFDLVIIPVTNITGAGFLNVLLYSLTLKTKKRVICNVVSDFKEISKTKIMLMGLQNIAMSFLSFILTGIFSIFIILFMPFKLKSLREED